MTLELARTIGPLLALKSKRGVTAIEYGLILGLVAAAIIVAITSISTNMALTFNVLSNEFANSLH
jgi:pilus assembly protein Flp/PilA